MEFLTLSSNMEQSFDEWFLFFFSRARAQDKQNVHMGDTVHILVYDFTLIHCDILVAVA